MPTYAPAVLDTAPDLWKPQTTGLEAGFHARIGLGDPLRLQEDPSMVSTIWPTTPGAIICYRRTGLPIRLIADRSGARYGAAPRARARTEAGPATARPLVRTAPAAARAAGLRRSQTETRPAAGPSSGSASPRARSRWSTRNPGRPATQSPSPRTTSAAQPYESALARCPGRFQRTESADRTRRPQTALAGPPILHDRHSQDAGAILGS
jgi:hypothetical protein